MAMPTWTDQHGRAPPVGPRPAWGKWSPFAAAVFAVVLLMTLGTVLVGMELYKVTSHQTQFNTR